MTLAWRWAFKLNFKLALGSSDEVLKQRCEQHLFAASMNILSDLVNFADTTTRQLQQQLGEKRKLRFEHHDHSSSSQLRGVLPH